MAGRANHDRYVEQWYHLEFVGYRCEMVLLQPTHPRHKKTRVPKSQRPKGAKRRYRRIKRRKR